MNTDQLTKEVARLIKQLGIVIQLFPMNGHLLPLVKRKQDEFVALCKQKGIPIKVTSGFRSNADQDKLYAKGRTAPGTIVTNAKGGQSLHNYGVAFDVCFATKTPYEGNWALLGKLGESLGLEWGGRWEEFPDRPHFQLMQGYTLTDFQKGKVDYSKYV